MEIVIKTDEKQQPAAAPSQGSPAAQAGDDTAAAAADLASRVRAEGAIDAGPARVGTGQGQEQGQPLAQLASQMSSPEGAEAIPAGPGPAGGDVHQGESEHDG